MFKRLLSLGLVCALLLLAAPVVNAQVVPSPTPYSISFTINGYFCNLLRIFGIWNHSHLPPPPGGKDNGGSGGP